MTLLDATYKTTQYAVPLFFLVVKTNVDYQVVASIITEDERRSSITEALKNLKAKNTHWKPKYFMTDFDDEEISSIESVFPGTN